MTDSPNVQISLSLFRKIVFFFECLNASTHTFPTLYEFDDIISELREKQQKINLRTTYTKTLYANNDEQRQLAYMDYMKLKNKQ